VNLSNKYLKTETDTSDDEIIFQKLQCDNFDIK